MSDKSDLLEERESVLKFLFDAIFRGVAATAEQLKIAVHHLGTLNRRLKDYDD